MKLSKTNNGKYSVVYLTPKGKRKSTTLPCTTKKEAEALVKELKIEELEDAAKKNILSQEVFNKLLDRSVKFSKVIEEYIIYLKKASRSSNTINTGSAIFGQFARDYKTGNKAITSLADDDLYDFLNRDDGTSLANRKLRRTFFNKLFDFCVAKGYCQENPISLVDIDKALLKHNQKLSLILI